MQELTTENRRAYAELVVEQCLAMDTEDSNHTASIEGILARTTLELSRHLKLEADPVSYFMPLVAMGAKILYRDNNEDTPELLLEEVQVAAGVKLLRAVAPRMYRRAVERIGPVRVWVYLSDFREGRSGRYLATHACGDYKSASRIDCGHPLLLNASAKKAIKRAGYDESRYFQVNMRNYTESEVEKLDKLAIGLYFLREGLSIGEFSESDLEDLCERQGI